LICQFCHTGTCRFAGRLAKPFQKGSAPYTTHTPSDSIIQPLCMVEAMDDSLLIACTLPSLLSSARHADRFQATYGWETEWRKSKVYAYRTSEFPPQTLPQDLVLAVPSVDYSNPSSPHTSLNEVVVTTDHTVFLRVPINQPSLHFLHLRDLVQDFAFPFLFRPLPLTALRRILSQCLFFKATAPLSFPDHFVEACYFVGQSHCPKSSFLPFYAFPL